MGINGPKGNSETSKKYEQEWIKESQREILRSPEEIPQYLLELTSNEYSEEEWDSYGREDAKRVLVASFKAGSEAVKAQAAMINKYPEAISQFAARTADLAELPELQEWGGHIEDLLTNESSWVHEIGLFEMARIIQRCYEIRNTLAEVFLEPNDEESRLDLRNIDQLIIDLQEIQQHKLKEEKALWKELYAKEDDPTGEIAGSRAEFDLYRPKE